jgi:adenosylhomocysteine nucleosidase
MIHFLVAFDAEARPLIDHFKLKRQHHERSFPAYLGEQHALIVSGAGKIAAAAATAHLHGLTGFRHHQVWINFGIAGHPSLPVGETRLCHQLIDKHSKQVFYPQLVIRSPWQSERLLTLDEPDKGYADDSLLDMEASSFFATANRYATSELVQVVKVVSDNAKAPINGIPTKQQIIELLAPQVEALNHFSDSLQQLANQLQPDRRICEAAEHYRQKLHFSFSQSESLQHLLQQWIALDAEISTDELCRIDAKSSRQLLEKLQQQIAAAGQPA